jgi:hypothetical protein
LLPVAAFLAVAADWSESTISASLAARRIVAMALRAACLESYSSLDSNRWPWADHSSTRALPSLVACSTNVAGITASFPSGSWVATVATGVRGR